MDIIEKLTEIFKEFPGIGERQAKRFVYFLMSRTGAYNENLSSLILDLKKEVSEIEDLSDTLEILKQVQDVDEERKATKIFLAIRLIIRLARPNSKSDS